MVSALAAGMQSPNRPAEEKHSPARVPKDLGLDGIDLDTGPERIHSRQHHVPDNGASTVAWHLHVAGSCCLGTDTGSEGEGSAGGVGARKDSGTSLEDQTQLDWELHMGAH
jgi:hypothetical protein